ncbi:DUF481 domain-containing protein, partial [Corynebacterium bovis]
TPPAPAVTVPAPPRAPAVTVPAPPRAPAVTARRGSGSRSARRR